MFLGSSSQKVHLENYIKRSFNVKNPGEMITASQFFMEQVQPERSTFLGHRAGGLALIWLSFSRIFPVEKLSFSLTPKCLETQEYQERDRFHLCSLDCHQVHRGKEAVDFNDPVWLWRMKPPFTHLPTLFSICQSCHSVFLGSSLIARGSRRGIPKLLSIITPSSKLKLFFSWLEGWGPTVTSKVLVIPWPYANRK